MLQDTIALLQKQAEEQQRLLEDLQEQQRWLEQHDTLKTMVLCDTEFLDHGQRSMAHLFGQTTDNQESVFRTAAELRMRGVIGKVGVSRGDTGHGYPGFDAWRRALCLYGFYDEEIVPIDVVGGLNTLTEAQALTRFLLAERRDHICIIAAPFHQTRAFVTMVSVAAREYPGIKIYNKPGQAEDWLHTTVQHSQGTTIGTRAELIVAERKRIARYQKEGGLLLLPFDEVFQYLVQRDANK